MDEKQPISSTENTRPEQSVEVSSQPEQVLASQPEKKSKKKLLLFILLLILLIGGGAAAYYFTKEAEEPTTNSITIQEPENVVAEEEVTTVADNFYIASSNKKTIVVYDTDGNQVSSTTIPTDLLLPSASLGVNDSIQLVKDGQRIFYLAGESPNELMSDEPLTFELFELVDGKPVQLFKAPEGQKIVKWTAVNNGNQIVFQTQREKADKVFETDMKVLDVASKDTKQLVDYSVLDASWSSSLVFDEEKEEVYYFNSTGGEVTKVSVGIESKTSTTRNYELTCATDSSFCNIEYPDFASSSDDYFVWGYFNDSGRFGINIVNTDTGRVTSDYTLSETYEQVGNVHWDPASSKLGFDVQPFGNEGQQKVGREERFMELEVGKSSPIVLFTDTSPGIDDFESWQNANVALFGYSNSGSYALLRNENVYKVFNLENKTVEATIDAENGDSATFIRWLR